MWFEQLGSSLHFKEHEVNKFWSLVFMAYKEFGKQIHVETSEEVVAEQSEYPSWKQNHFL